MPDWSHINQHISEATGVLFLNSRQQGIGGGSINTAQIVKGKDGREFFIKLNKASLVDMFEAEAEGLQELASAQAIKVPAPICWGSSGNEAYIVLEYISLEGKNSGPKLGEQLAALHQQQWDKFGWIRDNTIGSTPQINTPSSSWVEFYRQHRLRFQLELAAHRGGSQLLNQGEHLLSDLDAFFTDYQPSPSLLHGDLWGGNYATDEQGNPVIYDPAVYYGDREADIAMTELFGGFPQSFYAAYNAAWPLDAGYATRKTLYNLYHVINHFNLFGGGYLSQADHMISSLLSEIR
ncbi:MAG: fructosamine kinase family protein [Acidiferrobacterales bacterium]